MTRKDGEELGPPAVPGILYLLGIGLSGGGPTLPYMRETGLLLVLAGSILSLILPLTLDERDTLLLIVVNLVLAGAGYAAGLAGTATTLGFTGATIAGGTLRLLARKHSREAGEPPGLLEDLRAFQPEPVLNEEDLEKQLTQYLRAKGYQVERQVKLGRGLRADLRVGDCIVELKIAYGRDVLQRLLGQLRDYREYSDCVIALILDPGNNIARKYTRKINELEAYPIIIPGRLKRK
ncbi:MAG: hypothetical protein F7C33_06340 [Desulfurococcales archaeon]|nr:hypothetical protein [Desulfurococcales archaeon]